MFITLEGIEGSGKSTQVPSIVGWVTATGRECLTTREPGGTPIGGRIRSILLHPENRDMVPAAELLLYIADRVQHVETVVRPGLAAGKVVVCDRYFDATLVYQGYARGLDRDLLRRLHQWVCGGLMPDLTLLLDLPVEEGLARAWRRMHTDAGLDCESRFEKEKSAFHERVRAGYLELARREPQRFVIIDAAAEAPAVGRQIEAALQRHFERRCDEAT